MGSLFYQVQAAKKSIKSRFFANTLFILAFF